MDRTFESKALQIIFLNALRKFERKYLSYSVLMVNWVLSLDDDIHTHPGSFRLIN